MAKDVLEKRFEDALNIFVEKHKKNKNVVAILLTGSFVHSIPDKNSDLDICVILKDSKFRERGNTWIDGIEVEYFMNSIKQFDAYFVDELSKGSHTAHMFANSRILFRRGNEVDKLIERAKKIMNTPRKKMSDVSRELSKYLLDDLEKDLEDVFLKKDNFSFDLIAIQILSSSLDIFFQVKRINPVKYKRLKNCLKREEPKFANLYEKAVLEKDIKKRFRLLKNLVYYMEDKLDGKRSKEWKLRSKCTC